MSAALRVRPEPRYGSASDLAGYAGLSVKTVRRLVDAGKVRGVKVGRRLLIPYEDIDRLILRGPADRGRTAREESVMTGATAAAVPTLTPRHAVDERGRALPLTEAEARARAAEIARGLAALDDIGDPEEQGATLDALMKALDEDPLSDRKRFG